MFCCFFVFFLQGNLHAGNEMSHLKTHHPDVHARTLDEWNEILGKPLHSAAKRAKMVKHSLDKVNMSGPALELHCLRLITEHGLSFRVLDYSAFQDIISPMLDAMPKRER